MQCSYHGWIYNQNSNVIAVPSEGDSFKHSQQRQAKYYPTKEQGGLERDETTSDLVGKKLEENFVRHILEGLNTDIKEKICYTTNTNHHSSLVCEQ